ncbi:HD domain-containing phosphohydrolase [Stenotrophomonas sp. YAU14A_MKIMI4_1]|uniref:HD domain-containing phosphohydrolase n=1 Tax=Stenotrophomonas sp. YAU14A_MKIMI4_1 TaxID=2072408 RepID=UPI000D53D23C|nr:HD domain-containing phosphohydrolase [Stenotrophomonas sp. YAU14A_MKIMI4_1]AWH30118.1 metal-dependent phosphohydrolase [Stenotrophomonas sp. YAU14A_MKIMI4_1]
MSHAVPGPRQFRIRVHITALTMTCMALVAALLIGWGVIATYQRLGADARQRALRDTTLLAEQLRLQFAPAQVALGQIGAGQLPALADERSRLDHAAPLLAALRAAPVAASVYVAYPNGDLLLARSLAVPAVRESVAAPSTADMLLQTLSQQVDGTRVARFHFLDAQGQPLPTRPWPSHDFDPRQRSWYQQAWQRPGSVHVSVPYRFATTGRMGVTLSERATTADAVVGVDVALDDLAQVLATLRATPGTELALLHGNGEIVASTLAAPAGHTPLAQAQARATHSGLPVQFNTAGRTWIGLRSRLQTGHGQTFDLLEALPMDELAADARHRAAQTLGLALLLTLLLLPLGWLAGRALGRSLVGLRERSLRIARFDFTGAPLPASRVREVSELSQAIQHMGGTIAAFLDLTECLATEPQMERMLQRVLEQMVKATQSRAAAVYLPDAPTSALHRAAQVGTLHTPLPAHIAWPTDDVHDHPPAGQLRLPLRGRQGNLQGLLVLEHPTDAAHDDAAFLQFTQRLSGMLAVAIETRQLSEAQRLLFEALIRLLADAIDAKSPYTGAHCERVPQMAIELAEHLHQADDGRYAAFRMSEGEREAFRLGAWLHDCGKVISPEHIVDKATKLEVIRNRIHEVRLRFEILWRDAELSAARGETTAAQLASRKQQLQDDFAFVAGCNLGGEFMADEAIARLQAIGQQPWQRHFDDRLGLSAAELRHLQTQRPQAPPLPAAATLLQDLPEHRVPWGSERPAVEAGDPRNTLGFNMELPPCQQNIGELYNLGIRRGTLTDEDRFRINNHIVQTYVMLKALPWPPGLEQVPELAATHHERLDGKGYPRRLPGDQLGLLDRVMALCDVFEALTAADRPYKPAKPLSETLRIMALMCNEQHLDAELFRYFLRSRLWDVFAERFMTAAQRDRVDLEALEGLLTAPR